MQVHYEDLVTETQQVLKSISSFIGINFEPEMSAYYKHEHHLIPGNQGTISIIWEYQRKKKKKRRQR